MDYCNLSGSNTINEEGGKLGGYSMVPLLDNDEETNWRGPRGALTIVGNIGSSTTIEEQHYSYRTKDWRYIRYADGMEELYHHKNDPHEWKNLVDDNKYKMVKLSLYKEVCEILGVKL
nr:sulfatase/phosphatase domain-containing protein [Carboxylicivirga sediminis]